MESNHSTHGPRRGGGKGDKLKYFQLSTPSLLLVSLFSSDDGGMDGWMDAGVNLLTSVIRVQSSSNMHLQERER